MSLKIISTEVVEHFQQKYGTTKIRKIIQYYGAGLPERYWLSEPTKKIKSNVDDICELGAVANVVVLSDKIKSSTDIVSEIVKRQVDLKKNTKVMDFISFNAEVMDKFGSVDLQVVNEFKKLDCIAIHGFKRYGRVYDKFYPAVASILNSLILSSISEKKIILGVESDTDDMDGLKRLFGEEMLDVIQENFEIYSIVDAG